MEHIKLYSLMFTTGRPYPTAQEQICSNNERQSMRSQGSFKSCNCHHPVLLNIRQLKLAGAIAPLTYDLHIVHPHLQQQQSVVQCRQFNLEKFTRNLGTRMHITTHTDIHRQITSRIQSRDITLFETCTRDAMDIQHKKISVL